MCDNTVPFSVLCSMLDGVARSTKLAMKRKHLRTFLDHVYTDRLYFSGLRLILPGLDKERGTYGLKENVLGKCIANALGLAKDSDDAKRLLNWKKGSNAGNFPLVSAEVLYRRQSLSSGNLTIRDVNDYLDRLAATESRDGKTVILSDLINKTNAYEMRWIIVFILKELKLGMSEKTVLHEFHPDAEDLFNVTCDLRLVCEKLKDRKQRFKRQDIVAGKPVRPQLASRVAGVEEAWRKLKGKRIVAECKFDGDRIQIHKNGNEVHFYSRSFIDHQEYTSGMRATIINQVKIDKCILDGEMLVWNKLTNCFAEFGSNQEVAKAAKNNLQTDQQLCFVAFDILYSRDCSVTHLGLAGRQVLLKQAVRPLKGVLELLLPGNGSGHQGQPLWSTFVHTPEDINKFFLDTVENRDEGIVLKDMDSKWEPGDRSGKWIKLKPDYVHAESDLDALVIGCYLGSGRRGGEIGQFLLGLADKPKNGGHPTRFLSFCKVGSGLSDSERDVLVAKLKPYLSEVGKNTKPPSFYVLTNSSKERPDFWVQQPEKSVILEVTSDIRTIKSEVFSAPYSLRFPRTNRVRYDKPWYDCLDVDSLVQLVHSRSGNAGHTKEHGKLGKPRVVRFKKVVPSLSVVPLHMLVTDVSHVKKESAIFQGLVFYFVNIHPASTRDSFHALIAENGGSFAMNLNHSVTHVIAAKKKGLKYQAAISQREMVIHQSWVLDCSTKKDLLPLRPKYVLHFPNNVRTGREQGVDEHGDSYYENIDTDDLMQMFERIDKPTSVRKEQLGCVQEKYCCKEGLGKFYGCHIYFHKPIHSRNPDSQLVAKILLKRLELELLMHAGKVASKLEDATHMIVYTSSEHPVSYKNVVNSVTSESRSFVMAKKMHVVKHSWLEDAISSEVKPEEESYSLKESGPDMPTTLAKEVVMKQIPKIGKWSSSSPKSEGLIVTAERRSPKQTSCGAKDTKSSWRTANTFTDANINVEKLRALEMESGKCEEERKVRECSMRHTTMGSCNPVLLSDARESRTANSELFCGIDEDIERHPKKARVSSRLRGRAFADISGWSLEQGFHYNGRLSTGSMQCDIFEQEIEKVAQSRHKRRAIDKEAGMRSGEGIDGQDCSTASLNSHYLNRK